MWAKQGGLRKTIMRRVRCRRASPDEPVGCRDGVFTDPSRRRASTNLARVFTWVAAPRDPPGEEAPPVCGAGLSLGGTRERSNREPGEWKAKRRIMLRTLGL